MLLKKSALCLLTVLASTQTIHASQGKPTIFATIGTVFVWAYLLLDMYRNPLRQSTICADFNQSLDAQRESFEQCGFNSATPYQCKNNIFLHIQDQFYCPKRPRKISRKSRKK